MQDNYTTHLIVAKEDLSAWMNILYCLQSFGFYISSLLVTSTKELISAGSPETTWRTFMKPGGGSEHQPGKKPFFIHIFYRRYNMDLLYLSMRRKWMRILDRFNRRMGSRPWWMSALSQRPSSVVYSNFQSSSTKQHEARFQYLPIPRRWIANTVNIPA